MGIALHAAFLGLGVLIVLLLLNQSSHDAQTLQRINGASSVTCVPSCHEDGTSCRFTNLIYSADHGFVFILSDESVIHGLDGYEDLKTLVLAPLQNHSALSMNLTVVSINDSGIIRCRHVDGESFAIYRFKPDNIMHVIHDDLLPLFVKYREICFGNVSRCSQNYNLFFADDNKAGPYLSWYRAVSRAEPLLSSKLSSNDSVCFDSLTIGVANTYFFQYGFKKPQGPISTKISKTDLLEFRRFFMTAFSVKEIGLGRKIVTLISRSVNRKILNEAFLFKMFSSESELRTIDLIQNKTSDVLQSVVSSTILLGMHGAETILSVFLPECSVFVELFPFGIFRDHVSPIASLANASKTHFKYFSWHNRIEKNSIVHPEYPREFGGISGLSKELRREIQNVKSIPAVECCDDPYYLYRMYQDTLVDESIVEISNKVSEVLESGSCRVKKDVASRWLFPGPPRKLTCFQHPTHTHVSWDVPINMANLTVSYNVSIQIGSKHYQHKTNGLHLKFASETSIRTQIWLSCHYNGMSSTDVYSECEPMDV